MASEAALNALGHAVSGSAGAATSTAVLYPLDLVTTRLRAQSHLDKNTHYDGIIDAFKNIVRNEGLGALYSGVGADIGKSVLDSFLFFGFYNYLRRYSRRPPPVLQELALGSLAGACSKACTTPISNAVTRTQTSAMGKETVSAMIKGMYEESGLQGLWSGYSATLVLTISPGITFFVNRRLARRVIPALEEEDIPVAWAAFLTAALSKVVATALTYPFQTGKTRLQMASSTGKDKNVDEEGSPAGPKDASALMVQRTKQFLNGTIFGIILRILHREGLRALYDGLSGELLKSFFSHGLTMFTKGILHRLIVRLWLTYSPQFRQMLQNK
ncbi:abhydrolase domain-containing protein 12 [Geosmithia morbida]|uniref:Abhydrolase domain-containing protein 12 n=1 Tax=Geosmithia morbida TaxID=1094350 RepID=A0A9P4YWG2_9HYPO|nr:abhydrolase domain-containing protein 12 [Geosmithia morbida]KAF4123295.1 abhydrolase domain-containing protein 12 [Geosmithia morbida]